MFKKKKPLITLEDKIDEILRYQKSTQRWGIVKALSNVTFFILFIVLPIVGIVYFFDWAKNSLGINLDEAKQVVEGLKAVGGADESFTDSIDHLIENFSQDSNSTSKEIEGLGIENLDLQETKRKLEENNGELLKFLEEQN